MTRIPPLARFAWFCGSSKEERTAVRGYYCHVGSEVTKVIEIKQPKFRQHIPHTPY